METHCLMVHTSRFLVLGSCSGSVLKFEVRSSKFAVRSSRFEVRSSKFEPNLNTNREARTQKRERVLLLAYFPDHIRTVIRHQQRSVAGDGNADRPAPRLDCRTVLAVAGQHAADEVLDRTGTAVVDREEDDLVAV